MFISLDEVLSEFARDFRSDVLFSAVNLYDDVYFHRVRPKARDISGPLYGLLRGNSAVVRYGRG